MIMEEWKLLYIGFKRKCKFKYKDTQLKLNSSTSGRKLFQESSQICALNSLFSLLNETVTSGENSDTTRYLCVSETEVLKLRYDKKT